MKKFLFLSLVFVILSGCDDDNSSSDKVVNQSAAQYVLSVGSNIFVNNDIGYVNDYDEFVSIDKDQFEDYLSSHYDEILFTFEKHELVFDDESDSYSIISTSNEGLTLMPVTFDEGENNYRLSGSGTTCTCTSTKCPISDCQPKSNDGECDCTYCYETCTRSASITIAPSVFFQLN